MKKIPENELLNDLFSNGSDFRAASLQQTLSSARRFHQRRKTMRISAAAMLCVGLFVFILNSRVKLDHLPAQVAVGPLSNKEKFSTVPGTSIRLINDEELLRMFPGRPVALGGAPGERQFILLDEVRQETQTIPN